MSAKYELVFGANKSQGFDMWDLKSGTHLKTVNIPQMNGHVEFLDKNHMIVSQGDRAGMQAWSWRNGQCKLKCALAEKVKCFAVSGDGLFLVGGTDSGKLYLWQLDSGMLLFSWNAHYKSIGSVCFSRDGDFIVSGGDDGIVSVWSLCDVASCDSVSIPEAYMEWSNHSLPITSLTVTTSGRIVSSSLDRTCKVWDIPTKRLEMSFLFPSFIQHVIVDPSERFLFAAAGDCNIYKVDLIEQGHQSSALGSSSISMGVASLFKSVDENQRTVTTVKADTSVFHGHDKQVSSLSLSLDGGSLVSGCMDGSIKVWDTATCQLIKTLKKQLRECTFVSVFQDVYGYFGDASQPKVCLFVCFVCCSLFVVSVRSPVSMCLCLYSSLSLSLSLSLCVCVSFGLSLLYLLSLLSLSYPFTLTLVLAPDDAPEKVHAHL